MSGPGKRGSDGSAARGSDGQKPSPAPASWIVEPVVCDGLKVMFRSITESGDGVTETLVELERLQALAIHALMLTAKVSASGYAAERLVETGLATTAEAKTLLADWLLPLADTLHLGSPVSE